METKYPTLKRPKRKLCYFTDNESSTKQWMGALGLEDVDKMFDDLDPSSRDDDDNLLSSSPGLQISDTERTHTQREPPAVPQEQHQMKKLPRCLIGPKVDVLLAEKGSLSLKLDIDYDLPFKAHAPVKTSSPIDENMAVENLEDQDNDKDRVVSPILFPCEEEGKEEAKTERLPTQTPQCNGHVTEESDCSDLESPPRMLSLRKPVMLSHKNKVEGSCKESQPVKDKDAKKPQTSDSAGNRKTPSKESHPVKEKDAKKPQTSDSEGNRKTPRQKKTVPPVSAVNQESETLKKISNSVHTQPSVETSNRQTTFLQRLREAALPKPATKCLSPVKVPVSSEPEDDFLILEDDAPIWFSIPTKTGKKQKQSKSSSTDRDSSTDKEVKDGSTEAAGKQQESEQTNSNLISQTVNQKMKRIKKKEKRNEATDPGNCMDDPGNCMDELCSPEDLPAVNLMEQEKPNKKKRQLEKVPSKENDKAEERLKDTASRESDEEQHTVKMKKKAQKSSDTKRSKSLKDQDENAKTSRTKSVKGARKETQRSGAVNESEYIDASKGQSQKQDREELADVEDLAPLSDEEVLNSEASPDEKDKQNILTPVSDDSLIPGKRKRRQPGQWWMSGHQSSEEAKVSDSQPTLKKAKQNNKEPSAAVPSPVKTKKDRVSNRKNQTQPAPSSSEKMKKAKEKKDKRKKNRNAGGDAPDKIKASEKAFAVVEMEQVEGQEQQQEEVSDQDLDASDSSPLVLAHRDLSLSSGDQVFQRVYHNINTEKTLKTAEPVFPTGSREQLRAAASEKRRRKPPSNWWTVNGSSEVVDSVPSQPEQREPKPRKERKKRSKQSRSPGLGIPKNRNTAVLLKTPGGALVPPPLSAPKTVKRSLATFKDIFSSATETLSAASSKEAGQRNRFKVSAQPAEDVTVTDCSTLSKTNEEVPDMDAGESNSPLNHEAKQDSKCQSENMLKALRSGPSSMIVLEQYEDEEDDPIMPSPTENAVLSALDLCAPPLKPLILQPKDKANLAEWFKSLWSTTVEHAPEITPDQFDWYFHQGRAIGFLVDLNTGSICNGKILLGSYMKKPLWVDHSATTVFNLLTSSVSVTIDGRESRFHSGQSFMVSCGHAYSIQNVTAQPAVLYFTRMWAESSD